MPNEFKHILNASTSFNLSRQLPSAGTLSGLWMIWTLSGFALASCGGGGGGGSATGGGGRVRVVGGDFTFTGQNSGGGYAGIGETNRPISLRSLKEDLNETDLGAQASQISAGATFAGARISLNDPYRATFSYEDAGITVVSGTFQLFGTDHRDFLLVQEGDDVRVYTVAAPDHESPADANGDNRYEVMIRLTVNGIATPIDDTRSNTLEILDLPDEPNEPATSANSPHKFAETVDGDFIASVNESASRLVFQSIKEEYSALNLSAVSSVTATIGANPREVTLAVVFPGNPQVTVNVRRVLSGPDADDFQFVVNSNDDIRLETVRPLNFGAPVDQDRNNIYQFTITDTENNPDWYESGSDDYYLHVLDVV
jgi:hypothetical protein